jgi:hypothetical protein
MMAAERSYPPHALRFLGAVALLGVGVVHLDQYFSVHYEVVPVIGTLFVLNFAGAAAIALLLILPLERLVDRRLGGGRFLVGVLAAGGIALAVTSFAFLIISEHTLLFGFREHGYRTAIVLSFVAEGRDRDPAWRLSLGRTQAPQRPHDLHLRQTEG